jgi:hypothetical protein
MQFGIHVSQIFFDIPLLFTANKNDYYLDIYTWNKKDNIFDNPQSIEFKTKTARMAGNLFKYKGDIYYPSQNCTNSYGEGIVLRKIIYNNGNFNFEFIKEFNSTHPTLTEGMHTLNHFKDIVVIDVIGYEHNIVGKLIHHIIKRTKHARNK